MVKRVNSLHPLLDGTSTTSAVRRHCITKPFAGGVRSPCHSTEFDASNRPLQTLAVPRVVECTKRLIKRLPGGSRVLVTVPTPSSGSLSVASQEGHILGKVSRGLKIILNGSTPTVIGAGALRFAPPLDWEVVRVCGAHPFTMIYGVLEMKSYRAFVRSNHELHVMKRVTIPASVGWHGVLVYRVSSQMPLELIVRMPVGRTVANKSVSSILAATPCIKPIAQKRKY